MTAFGHRALTQSKHLIGATFSTSVGIPMMAILVGHGATGATPSISGDRETFDFEGLLRRPRLMVERVSVNSHGKIRHFRLSQTKTHQLHYGPK
jgi:hypothetical protein